ncbi:Cupin_1 domain-containing protein [Cephalotus follicularis]|uniref:Cupin_1 domain-containing protein n=1 Tax=Cephalotus follicularis TaxID=3775 RepID=A0A1Q3BNX3_CEPFO|nr:Cupin_1 domain-containing protein [Cephalotus follicularis]
MGYSSLISLSLCLLVLFNGCFADQIERRERRQERQGRQNDCQILKLDALEPQHRIQSEAGTTEFWDQNEEQLQCAGVAVVRHHIQQRGLLLPSFNNAPQLIYVQQGTGIHGAAVPGCPETYQSSQSQSHQRQSYRGQHSGDQHQKVRQIREGDVIALPQGIAHWIYNNGQSQLVLVSLVDTANRENQLDQDFRKFFLAGNPQEEVVSGGRSQSQRQRGERRGSQSNNLFGGFDQQLLADAFNIDQRLARQLQSENDQRGIIVRVKQDLEILSPQSQQGEEGERERERQEEREEEEERRSRRGGSEEERHSRRGGSEEERRRRRYREGRDNGIEEAFCSMRLRENIADPRRADTYNPRAGRINTLNSHDLPILSYLQLSAEHGVLYGNAMRAPHWNVNSHSIMYVTRGNARVQIVDNSGQQIFNDQVREGQLVVVPQNFAVVKRAGSEGFEWIAFKTNDNAMSSQLAGRVSAIRAMPEDVLINSYRISRDEARSLKFNREETSVFSSTSVSRRERDTLVLKA